MGGWGWGFGLSACGTPGGSVVSLSDKSEGEREGGVGVGGRVEVGLDLGFERVGDETGVLAVVEERVSPVTLVHLPPDEDDEDEMRMRMRMRMRVECE